MLRYLNFLYFKDFMDGMYLNPTMKITVIGLEKLTKAFHEKGYISEQLSFQIKVN